MQRILNKGPVIYEKKVYDPAKPVDKGIIKVYIFQEGEMKR